MASPGADQSWQIPPANFSNPAFSSQTTAGDSISTLSYPRIENASVYPLAQYDAFQQGSSVRFLFSRSPSMLILILCTDASQSRLDSPTNLSSPNSSLLSSAGGSISALTTPSDAVGGGGWFEQDSALTEEPSTIHWHGYPTVEEQTPCNAPTALIIPRAAEYGGFA